MRTTIHGVVAAALAVGLTGAAQPAEAATPRHFASCTQLNGAYPHGVGRRGAHDHVRGSTRPVTSFRVDDALYRANSGMDRDHDGVACEKR